MPFTLGTTTKSVIAKGPEAHKLYQEFTISGDVYQGQLVKLHSDGNKVTALLKTDGDEDAIGICMQNSQSAYGEHVLVAMKGYAIVNCKVAAGVTITPGPVYLEGFDATAVQNLAGYQTLSSTDTQPFIGWALTGGVAGAILEVVISG